MATDAAKRYLEEVVPSRPEFKEIAGLYERRLWHDLTVKLLELVQQPQLKGSPELIRLYSDFIKHFESKLNQLSLAHIILHISKSFKDVDQTIAFLEGIAQKAKGLEGNPEPYLLLQSVIVQLKLAQPQKREECKKTLEEIENALEGVSGIDTSVYSNYYRAKSTFHKLEGHSAEFYRNALLFLAYTAPESLTEEERRALAYDIGISALVGDDIYHFGDLLVHPIIDSLKNTSSEWLYHLLHAFNAGDIQKYQELTERFSSQMVGETRLVESCEAMKEKIAILALIELLFAAQATHRTVPFNTISQATRVPLNTVELLVMKALSVGLIKGRIDGVNQTVHVTWVQPRVLGIDQIEKMRDRLQEWTRQVHQTLVYVEQGSPELS